MHDISVSGSPTARRGMEQGYTDTGQPVQTVAAGPGTSLLSRPAYTCATEKRIAGLLLFIKAIGDERLTQK